MITLDYRDKRPIYEQVVEKIEHLIVCGALETDSKMPSVRSLAVDLSVNPNTIQRAYAMLEQDGYLYTITGRGNFVAGADSWQKGRLSEIEEDLTKLLETARVAGMTKEAVTGIVENIYGENRQEEKK